MFEKSVQIFRKYFRNLPFEKSLMVIEVNVCIVFTIVSTGELRRLGNCTGTASRTVFRQTISKGRMDTFCVFVLISHAMKIVKKVCFGEHTGWAFSLSPLP